MHHWSSFRSWFLGRCLFLAAFLFSTTSINLCQIKYLELNLTALYLTPCPVTIFLGFSTGENSQSGNKNTFLGHYAGKDMTTGSKNIFIGYYAGTGSAYSGNTSNKFALGNTNTSPWLTGDISSTGNLYVNGLPVTTTSSRTLKRNIIPFLNYEDSLKDLLETELYTYQYISENEFPKKVRMGVISEELPDSLQLKRENNVSYPDWPSIYGTLWAGVKALHKVLLNFKKKVEGRLESLKEELTFLKERQETLSQDTLKIKDELEKAQGKLQQSEIKNQKLEQEIVQIRKTLEEQNQNFQKQLNEIQKRL